MSLRKPALYALIPLFAVGLAVAQTAPGTPVPTRDHGGHPHPDHAAMHQAMCSDHLAMTAGRLAYAEARLDLTAAQKPLFNSWRQSVLDSAAKEKATCLAEAPKGDAPPSIIDRMTREQAMLSGKLQMLQAQQASLKIFYDSLSADQKKILDHPHDGHGMGRHGWGHGGWTGGPGQDGMPPKPM